MTHTFFYGLFMDADLLLGMGLQPRVLGPASLEGYALRIGERASLVRSPASTAYGMVIELPDDELATLYGAPSVRDYVAETVPVTMLEDGVSIQSRCYNLPPEKLGGPVNADYARQLSAMLRKLGLPASYAEDIDRSI